MYRERLARAELDEGESDRLAGMYWAVCRENARLRGDNARLSADNTRLRGENGCLRRTVTYYRGKGRRPRQRPDMAQWAVFWSVAGVAAYVGIMALAIWMMGM